MKGTGVNRRYFIGTLGTSLAAGAPPLAPACAPRGGGRHAP
jgi:hypothetical protein